MVEIKEPSPPASSRRTDTWGSSESLAAMADPAAPLPTTMKSNGLSGTGVLSCISVSTEPYITLFLIPSGKNFAKFAHPEVTQVTRILMNPNFTSSGRRFKQAFSQTNMVHLEHFYYVQCQFGDGLFQASTFVLQDNDILWLPKFRQGHPIGHGLWAGRKLQWRPTWLQ